MYNGLCSDIPEETR